jgi:hypothetical protein
MLDFVEWVTGEWGVTALAATGHLVIAIVPGEEKTVRAHMLEVGRFDTAGDALRALLVGLTNSIRWLIAVPGIVGALFVNQRSALKKAAAGVSKSGRRLSSKCCPSRCDDSSSPLSTSQLIASSVPCLESRIDAIRKKTASWPACTTTRPPKSVTVCAAPLFLPLTDTAAVIGTQSSMSRTALSAPNT